MKDYNDFSLSDGELLVKIARKAVTEYFTHNEKIKLDKDLESKFSFNSGVFVTLNNSQGLRGCIGYPLPDKKLFNALVDASIASATEDPRFPRVKPHELAEISFEVTVLTPPTEIKVEDPRDYPSQIKIGRDGLIVKAGLNSGLLLPQVPVEYGWNEEEFLNHTCEKAGLPHDFWKKAQVKILKFEGVAFKEENPFGKVVKVNL